MTIRCERLQDEVLVTVDGTPLDWGAFVWRSGITRRRVRRGTTAVRVRRSWRWRCCWPVTDEVTAERFYQKFKRDVLSLIEADRWTLAAGDVRRWLELAVETDDVVRMAVTEA